MGHRYTEARCGRAEGATGSQINGGGGGRAVEPAVVTGEDVVNCRSQGITDGIENLILNWELNAELRSKY